MHADAVIGRESELKALTAFLTADPCPRALVVEGEPGVGKTTLLKACADAATTSDVLACWPAEGESASPFVSLADLLRPHADRVLPALPGLQRRALAGALLLDEASDDVSAAHAVSAAALASIELLASDQPVLVVIDDAQWLDAASADVFAWVARRLPDGLAVRMLVGRRVAAGDTASALSLGLERALGAARTARLVPRPLDAEAVYAIVRGRLGIVLSPDDLVWVHEVSGGNAFYALELARGLERRRLAPGRLRLPESLEGLVDGRLAGLPPATVHALAACAHLARPTSAALARVLAPADPWDVLGPALDEGIVDAAGDVFRFDHPLIAAGARAALPASETRRLHRLLAETAPTEEERAAYRARCTEPPDEETAAALEHAADLTLRRGATRLAAQLAEQAVRFSAGDEDALIRRAVLACTALTHGGQEGSVSRFVDGVLARLSRPRDVARLLVEKARFASTPASGRVMFRQALDAAEGDPTVLTLAWVGLSYVDMMSGDFAAGGANAREALRYADDASAHQAAEAYAWAGRFALDRGDADALALLERARELERQSGWFLPADASPDKYAGMYLSLSDRPDEGREPLERLLERATASGDELGRSEVSFHLAMLEWRAGRWELAAAHAARADQLTEQSLDAEYLDDGWCWWIGGLIAAAQGRSDYARARLEDGLRRVDAAGNQFWPAHYRWAFGLLELSVGRPEAALLHLDSLTERWEQMGVVDLGLTHYASEELEALILVGREADAERRIAEEARRAERFDRDRLRGVAARAEGMLASRRGDHTAALDALGRAEQLHAGCPLPFDRGRTLLALGEAQRRAGQRRDARASLERALALFTGLGADPWTRRTEAELARVGGRISVGNELTPTEQRVAGLVAGGRTNREVARELVVTVRAVEANLTRIYAKLGVRSRAELAARYRP